MIVTCYMQSISERSKCLGCLGLYPGGDERGEPKGGEVKNPPLFVAIFVAILSLFNG